MSENATVAPSGQSLKLIVFASGLGTTALAMLGVYLLNVYADVTVMGWYVHYILPVGAILVGLVAALGYGIASWYTGVKINRFMLAAVLALLVAAYFVGQYIEFRQIVQAHPKLAGMTFLEYYDLVARNFAWKQSGGQAGQPLGGWGYFFRILEMVGFIGGGVFVPLILLKAPYCDGCGLYMHSREVAVIDASSGDKSADAAQKAMDEAMMKLEAIRMPAQQGNTQAFAAMLVRLNPGREPAAKAKVRLQVRLCHCPNCCEGFLTSTLLAGKGQHIKQTDLGRTALDARFIAAVRQA